MTTRQLKTRLLRALPMAFLMLCLRSMLYAQLHPMELHRLKFDTPLEAMVFEDLEKGKGKSLEWFMAMGPDANTALVARAEAIIDDLVAEMRLLMPKRKSLSKQLEDLNQIIHKQYLRKYQYIVSFQKIVEEGIYNCVTGTALSAMVLERLGIEFQIYEKPNHVYLTVGEEEILFETTDPMTGVFAPDDRFRRALLSSLVRSRIVTEEEVQNEGVDGIFERMMYPDHKIDLRQLAGLHYRNDAYEAMQASDWERAAKQYAKAYYIFPSDENELIAWYAAAMYLSLGQMDRLACVKELLFLAHNQPKVMKSQRIYEGALAEIDQFLRKSHSDDDWKALEPILEPYRADTAIFMDARFLFCALRYDEAVKLDNKSEVGFAEEMFAMKPWEPRVRNAYIWVFIRQFKYENNVVQTLDAADAYAAKYPFAFENEDFNGWYSNMLLVVAASQFAADDRKEAEFFLRRFETFCGQKEVNALASVIGAAYCAGVHSYVRAADYKNARRLLTLGLKLAPYDESINGCKRSFGKEIGYREE